jgi:hypothetical protein
MCCKILLKDGERTIDHSLRYLRKVEFRHWIEVPLAAVSYKSHHINDIRYLRVVHCFKQAGDDQVLSVQPTLSQSVALFSGPA